MFFDPSSHASIPRIIGETIRNGGVAASQVASTTGLRISTAASRIFGTISTSLDQVAISFRAFFINTHESSVAYQPLVSSDDSNISIDKSNDNEQINKLIRICNRCKNFVLDFFSKLTGRSATDYPVNMDELEGDIEIENTISVSREINFSNKPFGNIGIDELGDDETEEYEISALVDDQGKLKNNDDSTISP